MSLLPSSSPGQKQNSHVTTPTQKAPGHLRPAPQRRGIPRSTFCRPPQAQNSAAECRGTKRHGNWKGTLEEDDVLQLPLLACPTLGCPLAPPGHVSHTRLTSQCSTPGPTAWPEPYVRPHSQQPLASSLQPTHIYYFKPQPWGLSLSCRPGAQPQGPAGGRPQRRAGYFCRFVPAPAARSPPAAGTATFTPALLPGAQLPPERPRSPRCPCPGGGEGLTQAVPAAGGTRPGAAAAPLPALPGGRRAAGSASAPVQAASPAAGPAAGALREPPSRRRARPAPPGRPRPWGGRGCVWTVAERPWLARPRRPPAETTPHPSPSDGQRDPASRRSPVLTRGSPVTAGPARSRRLARPAPAPVGGGGGAAPARRGGAAGLGVGRRFRRGSGTARRSPAPPRSSPVAARRGPPASLRRGRTALPSPLPVGAAAFSSPHARG